ncbi:tape measure protein [Enterobacter sichuanensis]|uniref:tape measure protein n=1 Tax=Enterobacter sichuanensis TaxID=2071710 RepID=UPI000CEF221D|nr:tape measure protein [Enterobacter sichuanensis]
MAGTVSAGTIVYEVDMDTARLLQGRRDIDDALNGLNGSMGRLEAGLNRTERSLSSIEGTMSSLTGVAKALIAALSVQQVGAYAQAWQDLSNKLANAVRDSVPPFETLADVTERVFDISQKTRSGLDATATLYARLERSTRSYGVSVEDITRLTTIINQGFVVSGSTAEEASNAIIQLAQGLASGALRGDEFNSVNEQGNRLMIALADSMNVSIGALRNMAAEGKLTTEVIVNGLLSQGDKIGQEFAKTTATISQSLEIANNNITKFFGENATVKTGVKIFSDSVISLSENLDVLSTTLTIVAGVMGARYVGALTMATSAKIADIAASRQQVVADNQTAQAALVAANSVQRKALADKEAALSSLALAQAEYNVAKGSAAEMLAMDALVAAKTRATTASLALAEAETAQAAASARAETAARAASIGIGMARGALALIGGPAGAAMLAAGAIFYFSQKAQQAKEEAINYADSLDGVIAKMKEMNQVQLTGTLADVAKSVAAQKDHIDDLNDSVRDAQTEYDKYIGLAKQFGVEQDKNNGYVKKANEWLQTLNQRKRDVSDATDKLNRTTEQQSLIQEQLNQKARESEEAFNILANNLRNKIPGASEAAISAMASTIQVLDTLNKKAASVGKDQPAEPEESPEAKKLIQNAERRLALSKLEGEARARLQAQYDAEDAGIAKGDKLVGVLQNVYAETERVTAARKDANKKTKSSDEAAQSLTRQQAALDRLNTGYADGSLELAKYDAVVALGNKASAEQIAKAEQKAESIWKIQQATKAAAEEERKRTQAGQNFTGLQGQVSPVSAVDNTYAQQMAQLDEYVQLYPQRIAEAEAVRAGIEDQYHQKRMAAMWEEWQQQSEINNMLGAAIDSLQGGATSAITGLINGTQSLQESFANIGTTILNSVVGSLVQMGIEWVKSQLMGQAAATASLASTMAQATVAASAWAPAAMSASIATMGSAAAVGQTAYAGSLLAAKGMAVAGAREHGGPVSANSMYRVGEGGKPEIYQASNGSQYMIPGDNGRVISNRDMQGSGSVGGSVVQHITFEINTTGGIDDATMAKMSQMMKQVSLNTIRDQQRPNGLLRR